MLTVSDGKVYKTIDFLKTAAYLRHMDTLQLAVGFTGTRTGLTTEQQFRLEHLFGYLKDFISVVHHGACRGADMEFHALVTLEDLIVVAHPCKTSKLLPGELAGRRPKWVKVLPMKPPLERNRDIVDASDLLIVCPRTKEEEVRSGTWATWRYAKRQGVATLMIWP
jgi:hypothetical protein